MNEVHWATYCTFNFSATMSGNMENMDSFTALLHKCVTASNAYVRGCDEDIVTRLKEAVKV